MIEKFDTLDEELMVSLQSGCQEWAPGIEIISIRVTKPSIPQSIQEAYNKLELEKSNVLIASQ
jgi:erlin